MRQNIKIGHGWFGKTLKERDRYKHGVISDISEDRTRRFWLKMIEAEFSQANSASIIFTEDMSLIREVEALLPSTKPLYRVGASPSGGLSINPLLTCDETTLRFLTGLFVSEKSPTVKTIFRTLLKIVTADACVESSMADVLELSGIGGRRLVQLLDNQERISRYAARSETFKRLDELMRFSDRVLDKALHEIQDELALFNTELVRVMSAIQTFYAPILFHEPAIVLVYIPPLGSVSAQAIKFFAQSIVQQIIALQVPSVSGSLYLHIDGTFPCFSQDQLSKLQGARVGLVFLTDTVSHFQKSCHFHIEIKNKDVGTLCTATKEKNFRPLLITRTQEN